MASYPPAAGLGDVQEDLIIQRGRNIAEKKALAPNTKKALKGSKRIGETKLMINFINH